MERDKGSRTQVQVKPGWAVARTSPYSPIIQMTAALASASSIFFRHR